ncbi:MAG: ribonuclease HI [Anaerolineae bacterium]|nr:ribonuclease HI [Anaerolineae bacterium]
MEAEMSQFDLDAFTDDESPEASVYTDGGCDPNPGPGGWGAIIRWAGREWVLSGNDPETTNNRMELCAAAAALALLEGMLGRCQVTLYTDSQYVRQGITQWISGWVSRGWLTRSKTPVKNQDLWRRLHRLAQAHDVTWHWLEGHAGHPLNERADWLAREARRALYRGPGAPDARQPDGNDRPMVEICVKSSGHGAGGWGAVLRMGQHARALSGQAPAATANAMLIRGATEALNALNRPCQVTVYSDAQYLIKGASSWLKNWQSRGWQTRDGKPIANREEWEALLAAARPHRVNWLLAQGDAIPADLAWAGELAAAAASEPEAAE